MFKKTISSKHIIKVAVISALVSSVLLANAAFSAKPAPGTDISSLSYLFHLYYDNGQLFADRDFQIKYEVVESKFIPPALTSASYRGEVVNFKNKTVATFTFDPRQGNSTFNKGKISIKGPYVADALQVNFLDNSSKQILSIFVSDSSFCNDDDFCNQATGENDKTCPNDCSKSKTPAPIASTTVNQNSATASQGSDLITILIYVFVGLAAVAVTWVGWRWWKNKKSSSFPIDSTNPPIPPPPPMG